MRNGVSRLTVYQAIIRIFAKEPDAIVSVKYGGKFIAILDSEAKMSKDTKLLLCKFECPLFLKRLDLPPLIKSIIIDLDEGGDSDAES